MSANFVSLHNHTEYSFLDGAIRIKDLVKRAKAFEMPAVAITDHGGLFGAVEFYEACEEEGIKPIIGFEAYVSAGSRLDKTPANNERSHLLLLASNDVGWKNLMRLSTIGYLEGFYQKPRIDTEVLRKYGEGIIATSACAQGAIPKAIIQGDMEKARRLAEEYIDIFGKENFYFELQDHGIENEKIAMPGLIKLGREMGVPFIVANDAHYMNREDAASHEVMLCMQTRSTMDDPKRYKFSSDQVYFKSPEEMAKLFPDIPEAMTNTLEIAERCNVNVKKKWQLPSVDVPQEFGGIGDYLTHLARDGIKTKYAEVTPELEKKLEYELSVINDMGFASYFLIVRDFVNVARAMGIMVGCRGSAAGCLVAYVIGITDVDPIKYDLIFERFLNPERKSMPDADIDFADRDRHRVLEYVIDKYGRDSVCQIINFGSMKARSATKDVARVMGISVSEANKLSAMVGRGIDIVLAERKRTKSTDTKVSLNEAIEASAELRDAIDGNERYRELFRHAVAFDGLSRQPGMHAAGVIIAPSPVAEWAPLFKPSDSNDIMTQFDMNYVEKVGLVKMDFLGLRTLTVLQETLRLVEKYHNKKFDLWKLPENDQKTFDLFGAGETTGIFQFESDGMKEYLRKLKPTSIEDIISMVALYRPGPMDNIDMFINRKHGREKIEYPHPMLESVLSVTYGVIVYQEQVMRVAQLMGGFSMGQADDLRKAMSKKLVDKMEKMGEKFYAGAAAQGIDKKTAKEVFDLLAKFAGYGFNKAHATVYAHLSYQSAYLKAYYPLEYMTGYLAAYIEDQGEFLKMRGEAEKSGIHVLPPDVNGSDNGFSIEGGSIRIGLGAVKNVGKAADLILKAREENKKPFASMFDVCKFTDNRIVNKKALESLICAGAFDCFEGTRARHFAGVAEALKYGVSCQQERDSGQVNMFDDMLAPGGGVSAPEQKLPDVAPWPLNEQLQKEKDILGFYATGHPLDQYADEVDAFSDVDIADEFFKETKDGAPATICGMITALDVKTYTQKRDGVMRQMGIMMLESFGASVRVIAFGDAFEHNKDLLTVDSMILAYGKISNREGNNAELNADGFRHLSQVRFDMAKSVHVNVSPESLNEKMITDIYDCCGSSAGDCYLVIHFADASGREHKIRAGNVSMFPSREVMEKLRGILGKENVWISKTIT